MNISNVKIYDLEESLIASGYPMNNENPITEKTLTDKDISRGIKLVNATKTGNLAHAQFLTGIRIAFDVSGTNKWFVEAERYRFLEFVSSQSTMHRITKFDLSKCYNKYVDKRVIAIMEEKIAKYNKLIDEINYNEEALQNLPNPLTRGIYEETHIKYVKSKIEQLKARASELYLEILYTNPAGFTLTARMTTNYRCLRNIYIQRHDHRLPEWRAFCKWIESLPYAEEFLIK